MVVSSIFALREKADSALPMTKGARLMLSPPAIMSAISPALMARAAYRWHHAGTAQAVQRGARHLDGQAREQAGHACHVAVVFAGLVGTAVIDVFDSGPIHRRIARHQGLDRQRRQVVGTYRRQRAP